MDTRNSIDMALILVRTLYDSNKSKLKGLEHKNSEIPCTNRCCSPKVIMSYFSQAEMSHFHYDVFPTREGTMGRGIITMSLKEA